MNKELIKKRFERCLKTYNENAFVQKSMAEKLISMLEGKSFPKILEIGCGTGLLTDLAHKNLDYDFYTASDIVEKCKDYIKSIDSKIKFISEDAERLAADSQKYDLIISNAVFQWFDNPETIIRLLFKKLTPNGVLIFSTFGKSNFKEIAQITGKTLKYQDVADWHEILKGFEYKMEEEIIVRQFNTPRDVLRHMKNTGVNSIKESFWKKADILKFEQAYKNYCKDRTVLTYNPIYIKIENTFK